MNHHKLLVREISKEVRAFYQKKLPYQVYHDSTRTAHAPEAVAHTAKLHHILYIDVEDRFVLVEPNVAMDKLTEETLKYGLLLPVVPGFPATTVGGTFSGTAGGSSSFKHGFFDRTVLRLETVLADGTITEASRTQNPELFFGMIGTLGTLGLATLFQIRLAPAQGWVELTYFPVESSIEALDAFSRFSQDLSNDFIEGFIYGSETTPYGVITVGKLSALQHYGQHGFSKAKDDWFCAHAFAAGYATESVSIKNYLFRYDRGSCLLGRNCFGRIPCNKWTRWLSDGATKSRALAKTCLMFRWSNHLVMQDLVIPLESTLECLKYLEKNVPIYPLRLCPIRQCPESQANSTYSIMRPNPRNANLFMGIAIRGYTHSTIHNLSAFRQLHRELEHKVQLLGGFKWLYARNYYTEDLFWKIYPRQQYEAIRKKYNAETLLSVFERTEAVEMVQAPLHLKGFWNHIWKQTSVLTLKTQQGPRKNET